MIEVRDWGQALMRNVLPEPDLDCPPRRAPPWRPGALSHRHCMDQVKYADEAEAGNVLTMTKRLGSAVRD